MPAVVPPSGVEATAAVAWAATTARIGVVFISLRAGVGVGERKKIDCAFPSPPLDSDSALELEL